jgi:hypothetical protein
VVVEPVRETARPSSAPKTAWPTVAAPNALVFRRRGGHSPLLRFGCTRSITATAGQSTVFSTTAATAPSFADRPPNRSKSVPNANPPPMCVTRFASHS